MCSLCKSEARLKVSHIIPKFIGKWLKETSLTPYFRVGYEIEKRQQDLFKTELLCEDCEKRFSAWETKFANEIFHPCADDETVFRYGPWFVKFASSLAWRALQFRKLREVEDVPVLNSIYDDMEFHLSQFLLGREKHVSSYTQHMYLVGELDAPINPGSPMVNRYLARAVEIDFLRNDDLSEVMVYVKIPMFIFLSIGRSKYRTWMESSRIKKSGSTRPKDQVLHASMLAYLLERSDRMIELLDSMSPKSKAVSDKALSKAIEKNPDKVANSRQMRAMLADYKFYGEEAVIRPD